MLGPLGGIGSIMGCKGVLRGLGSKCGYSRARWGIGGIRRHWGSWRCRGLLGVCRACQGCIRVASGLGA